ncbi:unnamed protein product [Moneuplotes crassus]|uniref:Uncharacterized protein n=1 Tax=Euplotes crassus TaxID=5936 RepID=A0AAD1UFB8_EUPCR|nr:unnamed protein product [Moneuplotes crassus]
MARLYCQEEIEETCGSLTFQHDSLQICTCPTGTLTVQLALNIVSVMRSAYLLTSHEKYFINSIN